MSDEKRTEQEGKKDKGKVLVYDTTLRDGTQGRDVDFSLEAKLKLAKRLIQLGFDYIEGGWIPSNPKDSRFFEEMEGEELGGSQLVACGSTRKPGRSAEEDYGLESLASSPAGGIAVVGKTWSFHVDEVLKTSLEENLAMIADSIRFLKERGKEVIYDAEHFFDGFEDAPDYALETLRVAQSSGADYVCLCDTNGGTLPGELARVVRIVREELELPLGIHAHDDSGFAAANSSLAVTNGCGMVQGTINGYGERVGNADLCTVIPNLVLKEGYRCLKEGSLERMTTLSHYVSELANLNPDRKAPFVGADAFTHKAGLHVDAVLKNPETFEHVKPESVGNERKFLVSELAGKSTVERKLENMGLDLSEREDIVKEVLQDVKELEEEGYRFENADASFELLVKKIQGQLPSYFNVLGYDVSISRSTDADSEQLHDLPARASVRIDVAGERHEAAEEGHGPVDALDSAFRAALHNFFEPIQKMQLTDYKVRILESYRGTAAKPRVIIEMSDGKSSWSTVGVSANIIEASWHALKECYVYGLEQAGEQTEKEKRNPEETEIKN